MKKVLFVLMFLASTFVASAQDVVVKKDGSTILSKIVEIGTTEIKYKKWNNQNGPMYTIAKAEVQSINYENGEEEIFSEIEVPQPQQQNNYGDYSSQIAKSIESSNKLQEERLLASAKSWKTVGNVFGYVCVIGGIVTGYLVYDDDNKTPCYIAIGGGILSGMVGGIVCDAIANNKKKAAYSIASVPLIKQEFDLGNSRLSASIDLINDYNKAKTVGLGVSLNF